MPNPECPFKKGDKVRVIVNGKIVEGWYSHEGMRNAAYIKAAKHGTAGWFVKHEQILGKI